MSRYNTRAAYEVWYVRRLSQKYLNCLHSCIPEGLNDLCEAWVYTVILHEPARCHRYRAFVCVCRFSSLWLKTARSVKTICITFCFKLGMSCAQTIEPCRRSLGTSVWTKQINEHLLTLSPVPAEPRRQQRRIISNVCDLRLNKIVDWLCPKQKVILDYQKLFGKL